MSIVNPDLETQVLCSEVKSLIGNDTSNGLLDNK